jgi:predicted ribosome quality control (RQC) complex YloA/Tae2 family protein
MPVLHNSIGFVIFVCIECTMFRKKSQFYEKIDNFSTFFVFINYNIMKTLNIAENIILIGQNKRENWSLLNNVNETDVLFHLSSFPSCYVVLKNTNETVQMSILKYCAKVCKDNTKYRNLKNVYVDYTFCNNVVKGDEEGELVYRHPRRVKRIKIDF